MTRALWSLVFALALVGCAKSGGGGEIALTADKKEVDPGQTLMVRFKAPASFEPKAWVGVIPSSVAHGSETTNDQHDLTYQYLEKRTEGTLTFKAPEKPGSYDFRMNDSDRDGREVASFTFTVKGPPLPSGTVVLPKTEFKPGESVEVTFTAGPGFQENGWLGIIPSDVVHGSEATNDQHDLAYQYLGGKAGGKLIFTLPDKPGSYDFRLHDTDSDGREVASVTFAVK